MKIKVIFVKSDDTGTLEDEVNEFIDDKNVVDIKYIIDADLDVPTSRWIYAIIHYQPVIDADGCVT